MAGLSALGAGAGHHVIWLGKEAHSPPDFYHPFFEADYETKNKMPLTVASGVGLPTGNTFGILDDTRQARGHG